MNAEQILAEKTAMKWGTRDPLALCKSMGIEVIYEPLGALSGYYNRAHGLKMIHVNSNLPPYRRPHLVAACLYYALSGKEPIVYRESRLRLDCQPEFLAADRFAAALLDTRHSLMELETMQQEFDTLGIDDAERDHFYAWLDTITHGRQYHRYKEDDRLNQALYILDKIEGKH